MKNRTLAASFLALSLSLGAPQALALDLGDAQTIARAAKVVDEAAKLHSAMAPGVEVPAPAPVSNNGGTYMSPYRQDGTLSDWASKALQAKAGSAAGSKVGEVAAGKLASKVPFVGGFFGKKAKKKAKETGAVMAAGGSEFIKESSDLSFDSLDDMAVWMQVTHSTSDGFADSVAAAMSIYPDLETRYVPANQAARSAAEEAAAKAVVRAE